MDGFSNFKRTSILLLALLTSGRLGFQVDGVRALGKMKSIMDARLVHSCVGERQPKTPPYHSRERRSCLPVEKVEGSARNKEPRNLMDYGNERHVFNSRRLPGRSVL